MANDSWDPEQYHKFQIERSEPFFHLLGQVLKKPGMTCVDLGCGSGELTQVLHQTLEALTTIGLDNSEAMLTETEQYKEKGLTFKNVDIGAFSDKNRYDLVFSNAALQWCADHKKIFSKIRKSLRAGGQMAIQMPANHNYPTHTIARALATEEPFQAQLKGEPRVHNMLGIEGYASLMYDLGFQEPAVRMCVYGHVLDSREDIVEWVKGTLLTYYKSRFDTETYELFLEKFRDRLFQILPDKRPFYYPFKRILLWGQLRN